MLKNCWRGLVACTRGTTRRHNGGKLLAGERAERPNSDNKTVVRYGGEGGKIGYGFRKRVDNVKEEKPARERAVAHGWRAEGVDHASDKWLRMTRDAAEGKKPASQGQRNANWNQRVKDIQELRLRA